MKSLFELKQQHKEALDRADGILSAVERRGDGFTKAENDIFAAAMAEVDSLAPMIAAREKMSTIRTIWPKGRPGLDAPVHAGDGGSMQPFNNPLQIAAARKPEYAAALHAFLKTGGKAHTEELTAGADGQGGYHIPGSEQYTRQRLANGKMGASMYEGAGGGSDAAGGYAVSIPTEQVIVPLALPDLGIFDASMVIPTATDIKIPQATAFGTSALKAESSGTIATFGGNDPSLGVTVLSAYMAGALRLVSWELLQDVKTFQEFVVDDLIKGQRILEGQLLATGTGVNQAEGVFGNTGAGAGVPYQLTGAASDGQLLLDALFDTTATLRAQYQAGAVWIMQRATGLAIRRAQMQSNLFVPVATVDADGTERILGKPVFYDANAPALPSATSAGVIPILYGDFRQGYIVGVRGGAGINVKILDQPWASQGQLGILAYRRLDARVRRSEAIQAVTVSHS